MSENIKANKGWTPEKIGDLTDQTFVITGTTSGTGFEAAKILISKGAKVVMLNRNTAKAENTIKILQNEFGKEIDIINIEMDLAVQSSVQDAASKVIDKVSKIDALICNAAIAQLPKRTLTVDGFESQLGVNYLGHFTLQGLLFPVIEKSKGRIVTVGSMGYDLGIKSINFEDLHWEKGYTPNKAYSQSKLAQIMSVYELQNRLKEAGKMGVKVYACHPGASRTSLISTSGSTMMKIIYGLMKLSPMTQSAEKGAYPELMCATEIDLDQSKFYGPTGWNNWVGPVGPHKLEAHATDATIAKQLWEISEEITGITWKI